MRSQMWPLYLLFNKLVRTEERIVHESDKQLDSSESYSCRESLSCEKFNDVAPLALRCGPTRKPTPLLGLWSCLCFDGVENPGHQLLYYTGTGAAMFYYKDRFFTETFLDVNILRTTFFCCLLCSIWTVDLAYLLQKYSVSFSYFTVTLGANPNFSVETFYKEQLPNDLEHVELLFKKALEVGINIECRSISGEEISLLILSGKYIAIALVDQYKLSQSWLQDVPISGFHSDSSGYTGHYIVICGYDAVTDEFEIRDPASSRNHDRVTSRCLEEARKSFGTDEDLVMVICLH
ncbi:hypothetical protein RJ639_032343 [Escallonia herrerae]|uniref:Protein GUCD1 n=1 Tax=Escallonia herrerae TaxID=1293975 RepID=A0AA88X138_9ASTE|nr:hypothetical protein RJ639_032343 [Escallonia herrerae]